MNRLRQRGNPGSIGAPAVGVTGVRGHPDKSEWSKRHMGFVFELQLREEMQ
jgi:hypothetical protein